MHFLCFKITNITLFLGVALYAKTVKLVEEKDALLSDNEKLKKEIKELKEEMENLKNPGKV